MATEDKLTEQITIAAEGIKQLVEQGKKTLSAASSPAARAFAEAAWEGRGFTPGGAMAAGASNGPSVPQAVQTGISQIQAATQPQARRIVPQSFEAIQASMLQALASGADPVLAARTRPGSPLQPGQWPATMPGLPVGSPGNPAPPGMPPLPSGGGGSGGGLSGASGAAGGGFFGVPSLGRVALASGTGLGIDRLIASQTVGQFSAGHGLEQWNAESSKGAAHVSSITNMLVTGAREAAAKAGAALGAVGKAVNKAVWGNDAPWVQGGPVDGGEKPTLGKAIGDFFGAPWVGAPAAMPDDIEHKHESGKTGVGDGVR